ncbi:MAG: UPF0182 family protein [Clostridia bacterium]|nr:UPF0182 family protein [Clostridia bacterium]
MNQNKANKLSIIGIIIFLAFSVLLASVRSLANFFTDLQWFSLNGYIHTFLVKLKSEMIIGIPLFILIAIGLYFYLLRIKRKYYHSAHIFYNAVADKRIHVGMIAFSTITGFFLSMMIAKDFWLDIKMFLAAKSFHMTDPIFHKDISFYIFKLPLYEALLSTLIILTILLVIFTVGFLFILMSLRQSSDVILQDVQFINPQQKIRSFLDSEVIHNITRKVGVLSMIVLLLMSFQFFLKSYELMYSTRGVAYGASYTDIHVTLQLYRVLCVISFLLSFLAVYAIFKRNMKLIITVPASLIGIGIIGALIASGVQQLVVEPDEINKESEYLKYNIEHTQAAFNLSDVEEEIFTVDQSLTWEDIQNNETTINNIRINDARPLQQTYNQIQGIRLYYTFNDIDLDRYTIDGDYRQVFISAREMNQENLSDQAQTWLNQHLKYTHGYGIVMSPVNAVTNEGQPELMVQNIPPISDYNIVIDRPEIYFGELTNNYIVINTDENEFDYPSGSDNQTTRYEGSAGIELTSLNRLMFAIRESSMKLLVSSVINDDSRIILYRNIIDRVERIAPFLTFDSNPYLVWNQNDNHLYWIIDAYTTSSFYPYSQMFEYNNKPINYIRNSVKVVVDAYEGTTKFYRFDEEDPILIAYDEIFSDLFLGQEEFPEGLINHIRYPQDYFDMQTQVYRAYHVDNPEVFYNGEDIWDIANEKYMGDSQQINSSYVMFKLPKGPAEEFALIVPYTPKEKANMTSLLVARNDGENYGKLYIYKFPKDKTIQGPMMIESRIDQDSVISPQFTLWGQEGSKVLRGNLIVVPIENSILYVEPIYLQADNPNSLPEMKRVIVAYQEKIVMTQTLEQGLKEVFGLDTPQIIIDDETLSPELKELINQLNQLLENQRDNADNLENIINDLNQYLDEIK